MDVTVERWVQEVAKHAFMDVKDVIAHANEQGVSMKDWEKIDGTQIQAIKETRDKDGNVLIDVKFPDKTKNLELLGRYLKLFTQDLELKLPTPIIIQDENGKQLYELGFKADPKDNQAAS